jgi:hypothetical protein
MYPNLPLRMPACVFELLLAALAMPKSMSFTSPSYETRMFCGRHVAVHELEVAAGGVLLVVGVVEALAELHGHVAGHRHRHGLAALARPVEDRAQVLAVHVLDRDEVRVADRPSSKICAMFGCVSCTASFASSTNIAMNSWSSAMEGRMRLTATRRSKPASPKALALKTSAMPPTLIRSRR